MCNKVAVTHAKLVYMMIRPDSRINYWHFLCIGYNVLLPWQSSGFEILLGVMLIVL